MVAETRLTQKPAYRPGTSYIYSNSGYSIVGAMCERVTGQTWRALMQQKLFTPLGMRTAGFRAPASGKGADQPWGHLPNGFAMMPEPLGDVPNALGPAGTVHCSVLDWAKFAHYHVSGRPQPVLRTQAAFDQLQKMHNRSGRYAMGWNVSTNREHGTVLSHRGENRWWNAKVWLGPDRRQAVMVMTNMGGTASSQLVAQTLGYLVGTL